MKDSHAPPSPTVFLTAIEASKQKDMRAPDAAIRKIVPSLERKAWGPMRTMILGYGTYHYKYASGREGDWFIAGIASTKAGISLYVCGCDENGYLAEANKDRLGKVSASKSCIRFKILADLDLKVARSLVKKSAALAKKSGCLVA